LNWNGIKDQKCIEEKFGAKKRSLMGRGSKKSSKRAWEGGYTPGEKGQKNLQKENERRDQQKKETWGWKGVWENKTANCSAM